MHCIIYRRRLKLQPPPSFSWTRIRIEWYLTDRFCICKSISNLSISIWLSAGASKKRSHNTAPWMIRLERWLTLTGCLYSSDAGSNLTQTSPKQCSWGYEDQYIYLPSVGLSDWGLLSDIWSFFHSVHLNSKWKWWKKQQLKVVFNYLALQV